MKNFVTMLSGAAALCLAMTLPASAAQLSGDARAAIPHDVQQLIVIDYRAMQNSPAAMQLKNKVMPPELKSLEHALQVSGMNDNHDVDELAFASYRPVGATGDFTRIIGIAQGQFSLDDIMANFKKKKVKPVLLRDNKITDETRRRIERDLAREADTAKLRAQLEQRFEAGHEEEALARALLYIRLPEGAVAFSWRELTRLLDRSWSGKNTAELQKLTDEALDNLWWQRIAQLYAHYGIDARAIIAAAEAIAPGRPIRHLGVV